MFNMPIRELCLLQPGVQPNQIAPHHHQHYGAVLALYPGRGMGLGTGPGMRLGAVSVPNAQADQSGARSSWLIICWDCPYHSL